MADDLTTEQKLRKLNKLKNDIEEAENEKNQKIGERKALKTRLKQQFDINNIDGAKKRVHNIEMQLARRNKKIDEGFKVLTEQYDL